MRIEPFSPTSINLYGRCPKKFEYLKIRKVQKLPSTNQDRLDMGTLIHSTIAHYYTTIKNTTPAMVKHSMFLAFAKAGGDIKRMADDQKNLIERYFSNFERFEKNRLRAGWEIIAVENDTTEGWYHGLCDIVFKDDKNQTVVVDWKTGYEGIKMLDSDQRTQGTIYNYIWKANKTIFVFLASGSMFEVLPNEQQLPDNIIKMVLNGEFPRKKNVQCETCEVNIICYIEDKGVKLW